MRKFRNQKTFKLLLLIASGFKRMINRSPREGNSPLPYQSPDQPKYLPRKLVGFIVTVLNLVAIPAAIYLAIQIFTSLTK